jgi:hypothetical protein
MAQPEKTLTLLVPGLLGSENLQEYLQTGIEINAPALELLLSRSDRQTEAVLDLETLLFSLFGVLVDDKHDLPIAPITCALDNGNAAQGYWLRADPVTMEAGHDAVVIVDHAGFKISSEEAQQLTEEINHHFAQDRAQAHWQLIALTPNRWYLRLPHKPDIRTYPLSVVQGRPINQCLPFGQQAKIWHTWLTEMQMLLHNSPVNQTREMRGELPINSLWIWGGGTLPEVPANTWAQLWSNEPLSLGLAKLSKTPRVKTPANGKQWLETAITPGNHLVVIDQGQRVGAGEEISGQDISTWQEFVQAMEAQWIVPLLDALKTKQLSSFILHPLNGSRFECTPQQVKRWWKRRRPIQKFLSGQQTVSNKGRNA